MSSRTTPAETRLDTPGWYGKLPTLGDFASRRLPADFIEPWDDWLSRGIAAWREAAPDTWLDAYLAAPSWRFVLMPGALPARCGRTAWAGVLVPSIDRVGRHYPLTLAQPLDRLPTDLAETERLLRWLQRLDDIAVDALHDDQRIDELESALGLVGGWPPREAPTDGGKFLLSGIDIAAQAAASSLWLGTGADGRTRLHVEPGLPTDASFARLLGGLPQMSSPSTHPRERS